MTLGRLWEASEAQDYPLGGPQRTDPRQSPLLYSPGTGSGGGNSGERESASVHKRGSGSSADGEDQGGDGIE